MKINTMLKRLLKMRQPPAEYPIIPNYTITPDQIEEEGFYSQFGQDKFVSEYFGGKKYGVFVDVGANDGITINNTYYLEKYLSWTGLAIEPLPEMYRILSQRKCITENCCVSDSRGIKRFLAVDGPHMLSSLIGKTGLRQIWRIYGERGSIKIIRIDCFLLCDLLDAHSISAIDYLSIDTEGGELDILKTIDFKKYSIQLIGVENNTSELSFNEYMKSQGYSLIARIGVDDFFERNTTES